MIQIGKNGDVGKVHQSYSFIFRQKLGKYSFLLDLPIYREQNQRENFSALARWEVQYVVDVPKRYDQEFSILDASSVQSRKSFSFSLFLFIYKERVCFVAPEVLSFSLSALIPSQSLSVQSKACLGSQR